jgi:hypothetical protein
MASVLEAAKQIRASLAFPGKVRRTYDPFCQSLAGRKPAAWADTAESNEMRFAGEIAARERLGSGAIGVGS